MHSVKTKTLHRSSKVAVAYGQARDTLSSCIVRVPRLRDNDTPEDNAMMDEIP
jgi:hypothetical protein